jgi:hypothetical protein
MTDSRTAQVTGEALSRETAPRAGVAQVVAEAAVWQVGNIRRVGVAQVIVEVLDIPGGPPRPKLWLLRQPELHFIGVKT